jgi:hypothetical protein
LAKSPPQKNSPFSTFGVPITFDSERINIGGAMNIKTGIFTAQRKGIYFFSFSGVVTISPGYGYLDVALLVNGNQIGVAGCDSKTGNGEWETYTLQSTIDLKAGDKVWLQIVHYSSAILQDNNGHFTHFNGWMLQEDISP